MFISVSITEFCLYTRSYPHRYCILAHYTAYMNSPEVNTCHRRIPFYMFHYVIQNCVSVPSPITHLGTKLYSQNKETRWKDASILNAVVSDIVLFDVMERICGPHLNTSYQFSYPDAFFVGRSVTKTLFRRSTFAINLQDRNMTSGNSCIIRVYERCVRATHLQCLLYRTPEDGSFITYKTCISRDIP